MEYLIRLIFLPFIFIFVWLVITSLDETTKVVLAAIGFVLGITVWLIWLFGLMTEQMIRDFKRWFGD